MIAVWRAEEVAALMELAVVWTRRWIGYERSKVEVPSSFYTGCFRV